MEPMLPKPIDQARALALIEDPRWSMDEKVDGVHALVHVTAEGSNVRIRAMSRNGLQLTLPVPVRRDLNGLRGAGQVVLDSELVGDRLHLFDVASAPGILSPDEPWSRRRDFLEEFHQIWGPAHVDVVRCEVTTVGKKRLWDDVVAEKGEGVVFKALDSTYCAGKSTRCLKWKHVQTTDCIVYETWRKGKHSVAIYQLDDAGLPFEVGACTIHSTDLLNSLEPGQVIEVKYRRRSKTGKLIEPRLLKVRPDLAIRDCYANKEDVTTS